MNLLDRRVTVWLNYVLDNLIPVFLRDNKVLMWPLMRSVLGPAWREFAVFKSRAAYLSPAEFTSIYRRLASSHLARATDLHPACIRLICEQVVGSRVLDVGCGRGYLVDLLGGVDDRFVVGLDIVPPGNAMPTRGFYCCGDAGWLPFADRSFDTVVCAHILEHALNPHKIIQELRRVTRKRLIVIVPRQRPYWYTFDLHVNFFSYPYMLDMLMDASTPNAKVVGGDLYYEELLS